MTLGALALAIAGTGLYLVSRRTRQLGIRMAIGAQAGDVVRMMLREAFRVTAAGMLAGAAHSAAAATAIASLVCRVSPFDAATFVVAPAVLLPAALAASWLPARRATRIAPVTALRTE